MPVVVGSLQSQDGDARRYEGAAVSNCLVPSDEPSDDISFSSAIEGAVAVGVKGDTVNVPADRIDLRNAAYENVVDRLRFHKRRVFRSHDFRRLPSPLFAEDQRASIHAGHTSSTGIVRFLQFVNYHASRVVNRFNARLLRECLPQIPCQSSSNPIRQNQPIDDAMFLAMRHPGDQAHFTVDALDLNASREHIEHDGGFRKWGFFLVAHIDFPGPQLSVGSDGSPSKLSPEADGAKMEGVTSASPDRAAKADHSSIHSGQAVTNPQLFDAREGRGMQ